jgi:peptidoglycan/xylan/chitin deacetylase (PgdA/CDA1 family)
LTHREPAPTLRPEGGFAATRDGTTMTSAHARRRGVRFSHAFRARTLVLCYHAISETWPASLAVRPHELRKQLSWLVKAGYRGATFEEAVTTTASGLLLAVTFDDAFLSVLNLAYPILAELGLPGTVFAVSDFARASQRLGWDGITHWQGTYDDELRGMSWAELRVLSDAGWEIGSHTRTHPRLTQLDDRSLARELRESREACERALDRPCHSLAYPYGDYDARVSAAAAEAGYACAAIEDLGPAIPMAWPRIGVWRKDSMHRFRLKVSPTVCRARTLFRPSDRWAAAAHAARP